MIRKTLITLTFFFLGLITQAQLSKHLAPANPAYYEYLKNIGSQNNQGANGLGYIPPYAVLPASNIADQTLLKSASLDTLPTSYDLRKLKLVTPIENQGNGNFGGNCWAFSTMSAVESNWLKAGYGASSLSEQNMITCHGYLWGFGVGGNEYLAQGYFMRLVGPVSAGIVPYNTTDTISFHCASAPIIDYVPETRWVNSNAAIIKRIIMNYGAVSSNMFWGNAFYLASPNYTYCYTGVEPPNHAIAIVGWDDTKVVPQNSGVGAWICKNQWGTTWGQSGYFYISYHDKLITKPVEYYPVRWPTSYIDTLFTYVKAGLVNFMGFSSDSAFALMRYHSNEKQYIRKVGTFISRTGTVLKIDIYASGNGDSVSNKIATTITQPITSPGFYTFDIPAMVDTGYFYVKVLFNSPGFQYPIPIEMKVDGYVNPEIEFFGKQWVSGDGKKWQEIGRDKDSIINGWQANLVVQAYGTKSLGSKANFQASKNEVCIGSSTTFTDQSQGNISSYTWNFGKEANPSTATGKGPINVVFSDTSKTGIKHISLKITGPDGNDSITKDIMVVKQLSSFIAMPNYEILGDTVRLTAVGDGESYSWFPVTNISADTGKTVLFSGKIPGTYKYTLTINQGVCSGSSTYNIQVLTPPANDNECNAILLPVDGLNRTFSNDNATVQFNEPSPTDTCCNCAMTWCSEGGLQHSVWFKFIGPNSGVVSVNTGGMDTQIAIYKSNSCDSIVKSDLIAANDDYYQFVPYPAAITSVAVTPGKTYWLQMDGSAGGDTGTFTIAIYDVSLDVALGVKENTVLTKNLNIYPNPNNGFFDVSYNSIYNENLNLIVYDLMGKAIYTSHIRKESGNIKIPINLMTLTKGMYFISVNGANSSNSAKFIVK